MTTTRLAVAALVAALAAPAVARADTERYFEADGFRREGITVGFMLQAGGFVSSSCCDIGGRRGAGGAGLRLGTVATDDLLWMIQLEGATVPVKNGSVTEFNRHGTITLGLQYYLRDTLWLRGGAGFATYKIDRKGVQGEMPFNYLQRNGFAFSSTVGFDFFRTTDAWSFGFSRQDLALSYEVNVAGAVYPAGDPVMGDPDQKWGFIGQFTMGLGLQWY